MGKKTATLTQEKNYEELRKGVNEFGGLIFKLSDCKNLDSPEKLKRFCETIEQIYEHFDKYHNNVKNLKIPRKLEIKLRQYFAQRFMEANSIGIFTKFLNKMTSEILEFKRYGKDSTEFDCVFLILNILINNADADLNFGEKICEEDDLLTFFYKILDGLVENILHGNVPLGYGYYVVEKVVTILYNTVIHESKHNIMKMRKYKFLDIIIDLAEDKSNDLNVLALFFMSYVADETNVNLIAAEQKFLCHIISLLMKSIKNKNSHGFTSEELAKGILQLSKHDHNKLWLVNYDILDVLLKLLDKDSIEIRKTSLLILWNLAFPDNNMKKKIKKKFLEKMENMSNNLGKFVDEGTDTAEFLLHFNDIIHMKSESGSEIEELRQTLNNVLWVLKNEEKPISNEVCTETQGDMIMVSYCHEDGEIVKRIYNELKKKEYEVWIDFENKGGETMEAKAVAVKQAKAVIICGSYGYQSSEICRQEMTYATEHKKCLVPLIVEENFTPSGWLREILTGMPRFDMAGKNDFEISVSKLKDHLDRQVFNRFTEDIDEPDNIIPASAVAIQDQPVDTVSEFSSWTESDVTKWFQTIGVTKIHSENNCNGKDLEFLRNLDIGRFFDICKEDLGISKLRDLRMIYEELQKL